MKIDLAPPPFALYDDVHHVAEPSTILTVIGMKRVHETKDQILGGWLIYTVDRDGNAYTMSASVLRLVPLVQLGDLSCGRFFRVPGQLDVFQRVMDFDRSEDDDGPYYTAVVVQSEKSLPGTLKDFPDDLCVSQCDGKGQVTGGEES